MGNGDLDFAVDLTGVNGRALLQDAVWRVDALEGHMGDDLPETHPGPVGVLVRSMNEDIAEFAAFPVVYPITAADFAARDGAVPEGFRQLSERNRFYRIEFPVNLFPRSSWRFDRLEVRIEFNSGEVGPARPKAFQVFPNRQIATLAVSTYEVRLRLDSNLQFSVEAPPVAPVASAGAAAEATAGLDIAIGPFDYRVQRMVVETSAPGLEKAFWRFDDASLLQQDCPHLIVITQVPDATVKVNAACALQAYRNYNFLADRVRNTLKELPKVIRAFFQNGAPLTAEATYDLSAECTNPRGQ
jgi:hypothetical protein